MLDVACSPGCTLLLNVGCTPGCRLLRTVGTLASALAVAVFAPLSLAFAVAALPVASERARAGGVDGTRSESALRAPRSCDYVHAHTVPGRFQFETKRPT
jgi:hypothetical protein